MRSGWKICRNWWDGFWTQTTTKIPPISDYYFLAHSQCSKKFACKFIPWYLHYVDKLTSKTYAKTINLLCAGNKLFESCKIESCKTTQEWRMRMKYARKLSIFYYVWKSSKLLVFLFPCWDIIKFLNASMLKKLFLSSCNSSIMLQKLQM